ncbi:MAG: hypothetical protein VW258_01705 [Thalassolituus sp.]
MLIETTSDLIRSYSAVTLADGREACEAVLINDNALVISADSIALFRRAGDCTSELSGGFMRSFDFSLNVQLDSPFILDHRAGYVGLSTGAVLLIGLNDVRMYPGKADALRNQNCIGELSLAQD